MEMFLDYEHPEELLFIALYRNVQGQRASWYNQSCNNLYSPMAGNLGTAFIPKHNSNEIKFLQLQIGSKLLPEYPIRSHAECFYNLSKY